MVKANNYLMSKINLYRYLYRLQDAGHYVKVQKNGGESGWLVRFYIQRSVESDAEVEAIVEAAHLRTDGHIATPTGHLLTVDRYNTATSLQGVFDLAVGGEWMEI